MKKIKNSKNLFGNCGKISKNMMNFGHLLQNLKLKIYMLNYL